MKYLIGLPIILMGLTQVNFAAATDSQAPDFHAMAATSLGSAPFDSKSLAGHVWIADFMYTTCGDICPRMSRQMRKLQTKLPNDVYFVSFTIDPTHDTVENLQGYARDLDADPQRWHFVRMKIKALAELMGSGFKLVKTDKATYEKAGVLSHNSRFVVVDARGRIRGYYDALTPDALEIIGEAVDVLRKENR